MTWSAKVVSDHHRIGGTGWMDWASLNAGLPREALETGKRARSNVILQQEWDAAVSELNWDELILNK